jgi:hypothetical protein
MVLSVGDHFEVHSFLLEIISTFFDSFEFGLNFYGAVVLLVIPGCSFNDLSDILDAASGKNI